jgi:hypothetical protein
VIRFVPGIEAYHAGPGKEDALTDSDQPQQPPDDREPSAATLPPVAPGYGEGGLPARKRGTGLPIAVNAAAVVVTVAIGWGASHLIASAPPEPPSQARGFRTAEWQILSRFKHDAEQQLSEKDVEIRRVRVRLGELDEKEKVLRQVVDTSVDARRRELDDEVRARLDSEQGRLAQAGIPAAEAERTLAAQRAQLEREAAQRLEEHRRKSTEDFNAELRQLLQERDATRADLDRAYVDRAALSSELVKRERELLSGFQAERAVLVGRSTQIAGELESLRESTRREAEVENQASALGQQVVAHLQRDERQQARDALAALHALLDDPEVSALPAIARMQGLHRAVYDLSQELLAGGRPESGNDRIGALAARMATLERRLGEAAEVRDEAARRAAYRRAFDAVGGLQSAVAALRELDVRDSAAERDRAVAAVRGDLRIATAEVDVLRRRLAESDTALSAARADADALRLRLVDTDAALAASREESERLRPAQQRLSALEDAVSGLEARVEANRAALAAAPGSAAELAATAAAGMPPVPERLSALPGLLSALAARVDAASREAGRGAGLAEGWNAARGLVAYLIGLPPDRQAAAREAIVGRSQVDPGFEALVREAQQLSALGGGAGRGEPGQAGLGGLALFAVITSVAPDGSAIAEPLTSVQAAVGASVIVRRKVDSGEQVIARGQVVEAAAARVRLRLSPQGEGGVPRAGDLVYIEQAR